MAAMTVAMAAVSAAVVVNQGDIHLCCLHMHDKGSLRTRITGISTVSLLLLLFSDSFLLLKRYDLVSFRMQTVCSNLNTQVEIDDLLECCSLVDSRNDCCYIVHLRYQFQSTCSLG